jgi:hypothetical protein
METSLSPISDPYNISPNPRSTSPKPIINHKTSLRHYAQDTQNSALKEKSQEENSQEVFSSSHLPSSRRVLIQNESLKGKKYFIGKNKLIGAQGIASSRYNESKFGENSLNLSTDEQNDLKYDFKRKLDTFKPLKNPKLKAFNVGNIGIPRKKNILIHPNSKNISCNSDIPTEKHISKPIAESDKPFAISSFWEPNEPESKFLYNKLQECAKIIQKQALEITKLKKQVSNRSNINELSIYGGGNAEKTPIKDLNSPLEKQPYYEFWKIPEQNEGKKPKRLKDIAGLKDLWVFNMESKIGEPNSRLKISKSQRRTEKLMPMYRHP